MVNLWGKGSWKDRLRVGDRHGHTAIFEINNQQGPSRQHREVCSVLCNNINGKRIFKRMDMCMCRTESLFCPCIPETNTTLLINYTPI